MIRASQHLSSSGATDSFRFKDPSPPGVGCNALLDFGFLSELRMVGARKIEWDSQDRGAEGLG